jgi:hypothetical protein
VALFQFWLLPLAAGRYFNPNRADPLDSQNDDLLIFTVEVGMGIMQAVKIFGNDIILILSINRRGEEGEDLPRPRYNYFPGDSDSITSIESTSKGTQTFGEDPEPFVSPDPPLGSQESGNIQAYLVKGAGAGAGKSKQPPTTLQVVRPKAANNTTNTDAPANANSFEESFGNPGTDWEPQTSLDDVRTQRPDPFEPSSWDPKKQMRKSVA